MNKLQTVQTQGLLLQRLSNHLRSRWESLHAISSEAGVRFRERGFEGKAGKTTLKDRQVKTEKLDFVT